MTNGFIYFISDGNGHIKIGVTEDVQRRIKELQTGNAMELSLVHSLRMNNMDDAFELETDLHQLLSDYQVKNEWYEEAAVMRLIRRNWIEVGGFRFRGIGIDYGKGVLALLVTLAIAFILGFWR